MYVMPFVIIKNNNSTVPVDRWKRVCCSWTECRWGR